MNKELEALNIIKFNPDDVDGLQYLEAFKVVEQAILELVSIKEADPSEALEIVRKYKSSNYLNVWNPKFVEALKTVENYILKAQEQEKENKFLSDTIATVNQQYTDLMLEYQEQKRILELIKEKNVNLEVLGISNNVNCYNKVIGRYSVCYKELAEEEFDLLKKWSERK